MTTKMFNSCKDDVIDIFKYVLNNDVAKHIASYIAHPIHEYIGAIRLLLHNDEGLNLIRNVNARHPQAYQNSASYCIERYGYMGYKKQRIIDIKIMNGYFPYKGFAQPYIPINMRNLKCEIMVWIGKHGVKVYKSWTKQKMIKHYYKSII